MNRLRIKRFRKKVIDGAIKCIECRYTWSLFHPNWKPKKREFFLIPTDTRKASYQNDSTSHVIFLVLKILDRPLYYWVILRTLVVDMCSPQFRNLKPLKGFWLMMLIVSSVIFLLCMIIICGGLVCRPAWLDKYFTYKIPSTQNSLAPSPETVKRSRKQSRISNKIEGMVVLDVFRVP